MDYYQGVVLEYLRAKRTRFVNEECLIQLDDVPKKGRHWYCDAVVVDFAGKDSQVFLCEISYSKGLSALRERLDAWRNNWSGIRAALVRDSGVQPSWKVSPWVFAPKERKSLLQMKGLLAPSTGDKEMPTPRFMALEDVVPWLGRNANGEPHTSYEQAAVK